MGAPGGMPAPVPGSIPPPVMGGSQPAGAVPAPAGIPGMAPAQPQAAQPQAAQPAADPFGAQGTPVASGPQRVELVFDDKAVSDEEVGRKSSGKMVSAALVVLVVGSVVGWMIGSLYSQRQLWNLVVQDGKDVYGSVSDASMNVEKAQKLINQAAKAAGTNTVDYKALEELRSLENPFPADSFSRKRYRAFQSGTVDALFEYYTTLQQIWTRMKPLTARALSPNGRKALDNAAAASAKAQTTPYGCVPKEDSKIPMGFSCAVVKLDLTQPGKDGKVKVLTGRGGSVEKYPFTGEDISSKPSDFVFVVDKLRSNKLLAKDDAAFKDYVRSLVQLKTQMDRTMELQGRLITELGQVAKNETL